MKQHTTNYFDSFIQIAEDCPADFGEVPPVKGNARTVATIQFEMVAKNPYKYTSDEILFQVFSEKKEVTEGEGEEAWQKFFSRGQACFRASPLTKRYGWGVHFNKEGKMAIYPAGSDEYVKFSTDSSLTQVKAMKSKR